MRRDDETEDQFGRRRQRGEGWTLERLLPHFISFLMLASGFVYAWNDLRADQLKALQLAETNRDKISDLKKDISEDFVLLRGTLSQELTEHNAAMRRLEDLIYRHLSQGTRQPFSSAPNNPRGHE